MSASLRIGTSGFSYDDWVGPFYPPSLKPAQRLSFYANQFNTVEINSSFYQLPALASITGMLRKVPEEFSFFVKGHRDLTHSRDRAKETLPRFLEMLKPYKASDQLGGVLLQFPPGFRCTAISEKHLRWLADEMRGNRTVVEFRHAEWMNEKTMSLLRELNLGHCIVDMPQVRDLPPSRAEATSEIAYVRFHGQSTKWEAPATRNERYDYEYTEDELRPWVPILQGLSKQVKDIYVYFNNHYGAKAAKNAKMLESFVRESGLIRSR